MPATTDLCDVFESRLGDGTLPVLAATFRCDGKPIAFSGPVKHRKSGAASVAGPLAFGGVTIKPGDWCYADRDGVLFSEMELQ